MCLPCKYPTPPVPEPRAIIVVAAVTPVPDMVCPTEINPEVTALTVIVVVAIVAENTAAHGATAVIVELAVTPVAETTNPVCIKELLAVTITAVALVVKMFCVSMFSASLKSSPAITG